MPMKRHALFWELHTLEFNLTKPSDSVTSKFKQLRKVKPRLTAKHVCTSTAVHSLAQASPSACLCGSLLARRL